MSNLSPLVDELGSIKARIANLEAQEKALKDQLIELGAGCYEGQVFKVTVSVAKRSNLDMEAVRAKLSSQFIKAHTTITTVKSVRVVSR